MLEDKTLEKIRQKKIAEMMKMQNNVSIPNEVVEIATVDEFNTLVNNNKDNLILVDCWAPWCGPCKSFGPVFKQTQKEYFPKGVIFTKLNTDEHQEISRQFNITGIPHYIIIDKEGRIIDSNAPRPSDTKK